MDNNNKWSVLAKLKGYGSGDVIRLDFSHSGKDYYCDIKLCEDKATVVLLRKGSYVYHVVIKLSLAGRRLDPKVYACDAVNPYPPDYSNVHIENYKLIYPAGMEPKDYKDQMIHD